ncbi:hypothetical protein KOW79_020484 [Hemibagrus wyckioides]|uniref:Uncharacterized protein n=1 Tax=Hemibagrus wyckioides TaxID=337641 RepID=A0A9D3SD94_9TELE|nr:hypothetical protein KOW79_020484 [Hemibagrus wyckioides]
MIQLMGIQQSMEPLEEPGPSMLQVCNPQPQPVFQISLPAAATPTPSLLDRKLEIETDTLTQHKKVLCLQEEYYKLKIELLKYKKNDK